MTKKHSVLVDLLFAHKSQGFSGIPQDSRLLFSGLMTSEKVHASGLIWSSHYNWTKERLDSLMAQSVFMGTHLSSPTFSFSVIEKLISKLSPGMANQYRRMFLEMRMNYSLYRLKDEFHKDIIWRNFFASTVPVIQKQLEMYADYYFTDLGLMRAEMGTNKKLPKANLDTSQFDFMLFQDSRVVRVSEKTQKLIRYHDGLPVFASDTMNNEGHVRSHIRSIKMNESDSVYVCNSDSSLNDLSRISERAASKAKVIPYFLPKMEMVQVNYRSLRQICSTRISTSTVKSGDEQKVVNKWFGNDKEMQALPKYILSLATIEPRKNYIGLINAWLKLRYDTDEDIKLMIVGSPGWEYDSILAAMRPFVASGDLLHLEKVAQIEMPYLYSSASCFVFPSFGEGFGLPPSEAMQCGCPVALSDIPPHRYSAGDAALFFDPYDIDDMVAKIKSLVLAPEDSRYVSELIDKGYENTKRYSVETVLPQWETLFDDLSSAKRK